MSRPAEAFCVTEPLVWIRSTWLREAGVVYLFEDFLSSDLAKAPTGCYVLVDSNLVFLDIANCTLPSTLPIMSFSNACFLVFGSLSALTISIFLFNLVSASD